MAKVRLFRACRIRENSEAVVRVREVHVLVSIASIEKRTHPETLQLRTHRLGTAGNVWTRHWKRTHVLQQTQGRPN